MMSNGDILLNETPTTYHTLEVVPLERKNQESRNKVQLNNRLEIVWRNVILFALLHIGALYGLYLSIFVSIHPWKTFFWWYFLYGQMGGHGITAGAHRLWTHKSYKAKLPLRIFLMICQSIACQNHIYEWARDHRVHHKYTDTDADPYNSKRGFFFSHMGWLMARKHKDVATKGKNIDMSDLEADPVVRFQKRHYFPLVITFAFVLPTFVPWFFWGESLWVSWFTAGLLRYAVSLHSTWLVNSAAHMWGMRPYDKTISSAESVCVSFITSGEGWHNYHHVFPWDYKARELGNYELNITKMMIDIYSALGLAYDLRTASEDMVKNRIKRTGDGSRTFAEYHDVPDDHQQENIGLGRW